MTEHKGCAVRHLYCVRHLVQHLLACLACERQCHTIPLFKVIISMSPSEQQVLSNNAENQDQAMASRHFQGI